MNPSQWLLSQWLPNLTLWFLRLLGRDPISIAFSGDLTKVLGYDPDGVFIRCAKEDFRLIRRAIKRAEGQSYAQIDATESLGPGSWIIMGGMTYPTLTRHDLLTKPEITTGQYTKTWEEEPAATQEEEPWEEEALRDRNRS